MLFARDPVADERLAALAVVVPEQNGRRALVWQSNAVLETTNAVQSHDVTRFSWPKADLLTTRWNVRSWTKAT
jgi:hypothetical protein